MSLTFGLQTPRDLLEKLKRDGSLLDDEVTSDRLFNFVITKITPEAINSIGWRTFLMFAIFCMCMAVFVWVFVPETKQLTLEEIDVVFGAVDAETRAKDVEKAIETEKMKAGVDYEEGDEKVDETAKA